jgi:hypothetical protein
VTNLLLRLSGPSSAITKRDRLVAPGTVFTIRRMVTHDDPPGGYRTAVMAEVMSGPHRGQILNLRPITRHNRLTGEVSIEPDFLEHVEQR